MLTLFQIGKIIWEEFDYSLSRGTYKAGECRELMQEVESKLTTHQQFMEFNSGFILDYEA